MGTTRPVIIETLFWVLPSASISTTLNDWRYGRPVILTRRTRRRWRVDLAAFVSTAKYRFSELQI